jgi:hypothetical protein
MTFVPNEILVFLLVFLKNRAQYSIRNSKAVALAYTGKVQVTKSADIGENVHTFCEPC